VVGLSVWLLVTFVSSAKMAEPIEMPSGGLTWLGPRNHINQMWVQISEGERTISGVVRSSEKQKLLN